MRFPDVRTDENYNTKYLDEKDKEFISGFDYCIDVAVDSFFNNIDDMFGALGSDYLEKVLNEKVPECLQEELEIEQTFPKGTFNLVVATYKELIWAGLRGWVEGTRDELVTSILDDYSEEKYEKLKAERDKK